VQLNYLVTGAAGFIGARVAEMLIDDEHYVLGVDNLNNAYDTRLKNWRVQRLVERKGFEFHHLDICDGAAMERLIAKTRVNAVINLAARAGVRQSLEDPWVYVETNMTGTLTLLELARKYNIPKFILASTSSLYGAHNPVPYSETSDTNRPLSPYAASKKGAEALCHSYHHLYGVDVSVLRYFTVYGPAGRPDMSIFRFVQWISESRPVTLFGDGQQSRDFTYVDDIARGTIKALKPVGYTVINLGSDRPASVNDVLRMIETMLGKSARIEHRPAHPADVNATWADVTRARELLGWSPSVSLQEGIAAVVEWYKQNRTLASEIETIG
jgi:nucleoside-diphosphate-sugar epimerase